MAQIEAGLNRPAGHPTGTGHNQHHWPSRHREDCGASIHTRRQNILPRNHRENPHHVIFSYRGRCHKTSTPDFQRPTRPGLHGVSLERSVGTTAAVAIPSKVHRALASTAPRLEQASDKALYLGFDPAIRGIAPSPQTTAPMTAVPPHPPTPLPRPQTSRRTGPASITERSSERHPRYCRG